MAEEEKKKPAIYCGNAKTRPSRFDKDKVDFDILIGPSDLEKINAWAKDHRGWVRIKGNPRKEPSDKGWTHAVQIDTWEPGDKSQYPQKGAAKAVAQPQPDPELPPIGDDNLPF